MSFMKNTCDLMNNLNEINNAILSDPAGFILECEKRYHDSVYAIADKIPHGNHRTVIMLAGPSGSGKTTTAHILRDSLRKKGIFSSTVSLDDFYFGVSMTAVGENGKQDFESVHALDLDEIHRCFGELTKTGKSDFPLFDFTVGERSAQRRSIKLDKGDVVIVEGLHALNPILINAVSTDHIIKLYVNVDNRVLDDDSNIVLSRRDLRLVRRISRDRIYRNSTVENTLSMWPDVQRGEKEYLFPHSGVADYVINTFHPYEPAIFKNSILPELALIGVDNPNFNYAMSAATGLDKFAAIPQEVVPNDSLLREFISGGIYE